MRLTKRNRLPHRRRGFWSTGTEAVRRSLIVALLALTTTATATESVPAHVMYYMPKLEEAYSNVAAYFYLAHICIIKFTACDRASREEGFDVHRNVIISSIKDITLFSPRLKDYDQKPFKDMSEILHLIRQQDRELLQTNLLAYELEYLSRYSALVQICPNEARNLNLKPNISALTQDNLTKYWEMNSAQQARTTKQLDRLTQLRIKEVKSWDHERCIDAREFGKPLEVLIRRKIDDYSRMRRELTSKSTVGATYIFAAVDLLDRETKNKSKKPEPESEKISR